MSFMDNARTGGRDAGAHASKSGNKVIPMTELAGQEVQALDASVFKIQNIVMKYKRKVDQLGTGSDTADLRKSIMADENNIQKQSLQVKGRLQEFKAKMDDMPQSQQQRLKKAMGTFSTLIEDFQTTHKLFSERIVANPPRSVAGANPPMDDSDSAMEKESLLRHQQQQEVLRVDNLVIHNEALIEERDQDINHLVRDIGELNEMFQDVAVLVSDQGAMVDDIEANISQTADRTSAARQELVKAEKSQKKATTKKLWIVLILGLIIGIIIAIVMISA